jgi:hypothetical protein
VTAGLREIETSWLHPENRRGFTNVTFGVTSTDSRIVSNLTARLVRFRSLARKGQFSITGFRCDLHETALIGALRLSAGSTPRGITSRRELNRDSAFSGRE